MSFSQNFPTMVSAAVLFLMTILFSHSVYALSDGEVIALKDMQAEWGNQLGWTGSPNCGWHGLTCNSNGNLIGMYVYSRFWHFLTTLVQSCDLTYLSLVID